MRDDLLPSLADRLRATPAELAGLAVLLAGVVAVAGAVWWTSLSRATPAVTAPAGPSVLAPAAAEPSVAATDVTVHVTGAVALPGIVTLPAGSRVADAVHAAGGMTLDADPGGLNLARPLVDGEQIVVPVPGAAPLAGASGDGGDGGTSGVAADGRVDINRATAAELEELPGVGPVLAERIVTHREEHGPFREVGELRDVSGIGERIFQGLVEHVTVG